MIFFSDLGRWVIGDFGRGWGGVPGKGRKMPQKVDFVGGILGVFGLGLGLQTVSVQRVGYRKGRQRGTERVGKLEQKIQTAHKTFSSGTKGEDLPPVLAVLRGLSGG